MGVTLVQSDHDHGKAWQQSYLHISAVNKLMPSFHHSVAVLPLPLRKFRKNYVSAVRITFTLLT